MRTKEIKSKHNPEKLVSGGRISEAFRNLMARMLGNRVTISLHDMQNLSALKDGGMLAVAPHNSHVDSLVVRWSIRLFVRAVHQKHKLKSKLENPSVFAAPLKQKREKKYEELPESLLDITPKEADAILKNLIILAAADYWFPNPNDRIHKKAFALFKSCIAQTVIRIMPITRQRSGRGRESTQKSTEDLHKIANLVKNGAISTIFPEGTRSRDHTVPLDERRFLSGLGLLAAFTGGNKPIVPMVIEGTGKIWPPHKSIPKLRNNSVDVTVGQPIHFDSLVPENIEAMDDKELRLLRKQISQLVTTYFQSFGKEELESEEEDVVFGSADY